MLLELILHIYWNGREVLKYTQFHTSMLHMTRQTAPQLDKSQVNDIRM